VEAASPKALTVLTPSAIEGAVLRTRAERRPGSAAHRRVGTRCPARQPRRPTGRPGLDVRHEVGADPASLLSPPARPPLSPPRPGTARGG
jgi:hypothetical protein